VVAPPRQSCRDKRSFPLALHRPVYDRTCSGLAVRRGAFELAARCYDRLLDFFHSPEPLVMIADAYRVCAAVASRALARRCALILRLRRNAGRLRSAPQGRPRRYGDKIKLRTLLYTSTDLWQEVQSPVHRQRDVKFPRRYDPLGRRRQRL
jgi:hypothetical protein